MTPSFDPADTEQSYDSVAAFYDDFTAHHDYELWTGEITAAASRHGLRGHRLLDVGCGTGKSFLPFLRRGWRVVACDASVQMLARAAAKVTADDVALHHADARELPTFGEFDLVLALDDVLNYIEAFELVGALSGLRRNLAPGGLVVFDCNTERTYRSFFTETEVCDLPDGLALWRGRVDPRHWQAGQRAVADLDAFLQTPGGAWERRSSVQLQHHHRPETVSAALRESGLEQLAAYGHGFDAQLVQPLDEQRHTKALYLARATAHEH